MIRPASYFEFIVRHCRTHWYARRHHWPNTGAHFRRASTTTLPDNAMQRRSAFRDRGRAAKSRSCVFGMKYSTRGTVRIGVLVPFTNTNLESEMILMCPSEATMHFQRIGGYDADAVPSSDQMAGFGMSSMNHDVRMIAGVKPNAILLGCTSATLTHGPTFDAELTKKIAMQSGSIALTAAGCLVAAIRTISATKIGFASPYTRDLNKHAESYLRENAIETVSRAEIGRELDNWDQGELTPEEVFDLAMHANSDEAQAIVLSCTDLRTIDAIPKIEEKLGKPVISSNQAMMYCAMAKLRLKKRSGLPGRLFDLL